MLNRGWAADIACVLIMVGLRSSDYRWPDVSAHVRRRIEIARRIAGGGNIR